MGENMGQGYSVTRWYILAKDTKAHENFRVTLNNASEYRPNGLYGQMVFFVNLCI